VSIERSPVAGRAGTLERPHDERVRERLRWRCRRGLLELDILLGRFLERELSALTESEIDAFVRLLETPDQTLLEWLQGKSEPADQSLNLLVRKIQ
jgi:antitoxin CptB